MATIAPSAKRARTSDEALTAKDKEECKRSLRRFRLLFPKAAPVIHSSLGLLQFSDGELHWDVTALNELSMMVHLDADMMVPDLQDIGAPNASAIFGSGGHLRVLAAMKRHSGNVTIQDHALQIFEKIAVLPDEQGCASLANLGCIDDALLAIQLHPSHNDTVENALDLIYQLLKAFPLEETQLEDLAERDIIGITLQSVTNRIGQQSWFWSATRVLEQLLKFQKIPRTSFDRHQIASLLTALVQVPSHDEDLEKIFKKILAAGRE